MKKPSALVSLAVLAWCACLTAQAAAEGDAGSSAAAFLNILPGARQAALGGSTAGLNGDVDSVLVNPAASADLDGVRMGFSHVSWLFGISMEHFALFYEAPGIGTFGLFGNFLKMPAFEITDPSGVFQADFASGRGFRMGISFGRSFGRGLTAGDLAVGAAVSYYQEDLDAWRSRGVILDAGARYRLLRGLSLGIAAANLGAPVSRSGSSFALPMTLRAGLAWTLVPADRRIVRQASLSASGLVLKNGEPDVQSGLELLLDFPGATDFSAALRAGMKSVRSAETAANLSFGFGLYFRMLGIDYSVSPGETGTGNVHRLSLAYSVAPAGAPARGK